MRHTHTDKYFCSGNAIVVASTTACVIALTWGGVVFPWSSARVLVPLVLGLVGLVALMIFEAIVPRNPLVSNDTMDSHDRFLITAVDSVFGSVDRDWNKWLHSDVSNIFLPSRYHL